MIRPDNLQLVVMNNQRVPRGSGKSLSKEGLSPADPVASLAMDARKHNRKKGNK